ncbi:MAG: leucine-rich repeat domain-containing protein [Gallionella sp.]|nr:leucine-rich repeat domain-containing protein [Gallionella sp.]
MNVWRCLGFLCLCFQSGAYAVTFDSLELALFAPEQATELKIMSRKDVDRIPPQLGSLINLERLDLSCLENLSALPSEIGKLEKLRSLTINNGNGCIMNVSIPENIGQLQNLVGLVLYGALDGRNALDGTGLSKPSKPLPKAISRLHALRSLELGRNGLNSVPPQVAALQELRYLGLHYNRITELPAFVGNLKHLQVLSLSGNPRMKLPLSLNKLPGLDINMGNNGFTLREQDALRKQFPHLFFSFRNEYEDGAANEEEHCAK